MPSTLSIICWTSAASVDPTTSSSHQPSTLTSRSRLIDSSGSFIHHTSTCSTTRTSPSKQKGSSVPSISGTIWRTLAASADLTTSPSHQPSTLTSRSKRKGSSEPLIYLISTCPTTLTSTSRQRGSSRPFIHSTSTSSRTSTGKLHQETISRLGRVIVEYHQRTHHWSTSHVYRTTRSTSKVLTSRPSPST